jgi:hypothetical protein
MAQADKSNTTSPSRRAVMAGGAAVSALAIIPAAAIAAGSTAVAEANDADLIALGRRYEKLLLDYMNATLQWAPLMRAAHAEAPLGLDYADEWNELTKKQQRARDRKLREVLKRNGGHAAAKRMEALFKDMEPLAEAIKDASASSLGGLRAKALVVLFETKPSMADHDGNFEFPDDGGASRSLFNAVAGLTGLSPMVREIEHRFAADATVEEAAA